MGIGLSVSITVVSLAIVGCEDDTTSGTGRGTEGTASTTGLSTPMTTEIGSESGSASGSSSANADSSSTADTNGDTDSGGSGSTTGSGTDSGTDSGSDSGSGVCTAVDTTPLVHEAFIGDSACEGVPMNAIIDDVDGLLSHNGAYCDTLNTCVQPSPGCPFAPEPDLDGNRVVYVFGTSGGCTGTAQITSVVDCGAQVEVHYSIGFIGPCGLRVHAWDSVIIPDGPPVVFIED